MVTLEGSTVYLYIYVFFFYGAFCFCDNFMDYPWLPCHHGLIGSLLYIFIYFFPPHGIFRIHANPEDGIQPCLKAEMDLTSSYLILSDIKRKVSIYPIKIQACNYLCTNYYVTTYVLTLKT